jgi:hypothetical protein
MILGQIKHSTLKTLISVTILNADIKHPILGKVNSNTFDLAWDLNGRPVWNKIRFEICTPVENSNIINNIHDNW